MSACFLFQLPESLSVATDIRFFGGCPRWLLGMSCSSARRICASGCRSNGVWFTVHNEIVVYRPRGERQNQSKASKLRKLLTKSSKQEVQGRGLPNQHSSMYDSLTPMIILHSLTECSPEYPIHAPHIIYRTHCIVFFLNAMALKFNKATDQCP